MSVNPASIEDYVCDVSKPDDFGMFWSEIMCLAADIPLNIEMILDPLRVIKWTLRSLRSGLAEDLLR